MRFVKNIVYSVIVVILAVLVYACVWPSLDYRGPPEQAVHDEHGADSIVVVDKTGKHTVHDQFMRDMMDKTDRDAAEFQKNQPSKAEREAEFRRVWTDIKSRMVDPKPETYPVRFFEIRDGVPLISSTDNFLGALPVWLDNDHVIYWGGDYKPGALEEKREDRDRGPWFDHYRLVILDVNNGQIVNTIAESTKDGVNCFDAKTRNYIYSLPDDRLPEGADPKTAPTIIRHFGSIDTALRFHQTFDTTERPNASSAIDCGAHDEAVARTLIRPEDGTIRNKPGAVKDKRIWGDFVLTRSDGSTKDVSIGMGANPYFKYDTFRDQYFLTVHYSLKDQRTKVIYFDHDFNVTDEFVLPRVLLSESEPDSLLGLMGVPVKDGFAMPCGRRGDEPGALDIDDMPIRHYLCHVKRNETIVRAVTGDVHSIAVSPNGCRVFGYWKAYSRDRRSTGKNFMVDTCARNETRGESR